MKEKPKKVPASEGRTSIIPQTNSRPRAQLEVEQEESDDEMGFALFDDDALALATTVASLHSKGAVGATYKIPGLATIPADHKAHNITIVEVELDATLSWVTVPKLDTRAHLQVSLLRLIVS